MVGESGRRNPHGLTKNQHVLPRSLIARHVDRDGFVDCFIVKQAKQCRLRPDNPIFCVNRVWSQLGESGATTKKVEGDFKLLVDRVESRSVENLSGSDSLLATQFYALIRERERLRDEPPANIRFASGEALEIEEDEQQRLDKMGILFQSNGVFESRMVSSVRLMGSVVWATRNLDDVQWGVVRSTHLNFVVPDSIGELGFIPIGPREILLQGSRSFVMDANRVRDLNLWMRASAKKYVFSRDLSKT
ncbi:hypothetical protein [Stenotrophomonas muris]|uniref:hypothetical protein n=1 Tax=Stenotrophomonas muris TaxID=2963283 RepID=UPI0040557866